MSACLSDCVYVCVSVNVLSVVFVCLPVVAVYLSACLYVYMSVYICMPVYL